MQEFLPAAPVLLVLIGATISVGLEGAIPRLMRTTVQAAWTLLVLFSALCWTVLNLLDQTDQLSLHQVVALDKPTWWSWILLLGFGVLATLLFAERRVGGGDSAFVADASASPSSVAEREAIANRQEHSEVFGLLLFSISGMMMFTAATDLLMMFVALEVFSFPLYILAGMARRRRLLSQEASLKYFLLGALSSAIFLYGIALTYGYAGAFSFRAIDKAILLNEQSPWLLLAGLGLLMVGVLFKLGAVPFHSWVPDVYTGSPTAVTGFMAICTKLAAAIGLLRLLYSALGSLRWDWQIVIAVVAVLTMAVGAMIGLVQKDVKRVLAYSSIAHAGFILVAVVGAATTLNIVHPGQITSIGAVLVYLAAYGLATLGAFAVVTLVRRSGAEATGYASWEGLGKRNPMLGIVMTIFLLSMAGIPLTAGFVGKVLAFIAGWQGGYAWLVLLAVAFSLVTAGFYFKIIYLIFGKTPSKETAVVKPGIGTSVVIWVGVIGTILLGIAPGPVLEWIAAGTEFIR